MWTSATPTIKQPWTLWTSSPLHMPAKKSNNSLEVSQKSNTPVVFLLLLLFLFLFMLCIPPFHFSFYLSLDLFVFPRPLSCFPFPLHFLSSLSLLCLSLLTFYILKDQIPFHSLLYLSFHSFPYHTFFYPLHFPPPGSFLLSFFPSFLLSFLPSFLPSFLSFFLSFYVIYLISVHEPLFIVSLDWKYTIVV